MKKTDVEQWLLSFFSERKDVSGQDRDELLGSNYLENGLIDSMGIIQLVLALEKRFSVNIGNDAFQDRRFVTASGLAELVMELLPANHVGSETYTKSDFIDAIRNCGSHGF